MTAESDVLAAIEELEREEAEERRPWFEAPERAFRRGARMEVAPPPFELANEVRGHGAFPDAVETHYDRGEVAGRSWPSFRGLVSSAPEADDIRRMREWSDCILRLSMTLRLHIYGGSPVVLLPREYPAMETVFGMRVHHIAIRGGYVGYRYDGDFSGIANAMGTYWALGRAEGEPWIVAGRELLRSAVRSERRFLEPLRPSIGDITSTSAPVMPRSFSELERMRVVDLPAVEGVFVGYSMILPLITDMERELERQRLRDLG